MSRSRASDIIQSAEAVAKLSGIQDILPSKESHVRELLKLESDNHRAILLVGFPCFSQFVRIRTFENMLIIFFAASFCGSPMLIQRLLLLKKLVRRYGLVRAQNSITTQNDSSHASSSSSISNQTIVAPINEKRPPA